jgi:hypothetical protein
MSSAGDRQDRASRADRGYHPRLHSVPHRAPPALQSRRCHRRGTGKTARRARTADTIRGFTEFRTARLRHCKAADVIGGGPARPLSRRRDAVPIRVARLLVDVVNRAMPVIDLVDVPAPVPPAPDGSAMPRARMDRPRQLLADPLRRAVRVQTRVRDEQMHVRWGNRKRSDRPCRCAVASSQRDPRRPHHGWREDNRFVQHALGRHALTHRIAGVQRMRFDVAKILVPCCRPRASFVTRKPLAVRGPDDVIADDVR